MRTLFISGAAFHIFLEMGALKHILSLSSFETFFGTSSGAYLSLALVLGWTPDALLKWMIDHAEENQNDLNESYLRLFYSGSLISKEGQSRFIVRMIQDSPIYLKYFLGKDPAQITFEELSKVTSKRFLCNAVCYETTEFHIFSFETTPTLPVNTAVMASMSLIGMFQPTEIDGFKFIDGAFISHYALVLFDPNSELYYKNKYDVSLPINIDLSWGCLKITKNILYGSNAVRSGKWSFWSLIEFIPKLHDYFYAINIRDGLSRIMNRTWIVNNKNIQSKRIPSVKEALELFDQGYHQALQQGNLDL